MTINEQYFNYILKFNKSWISEMSRKTLLARELRDKLEELTGESVPTSLNPASVIKEIKDTGRLHYYKAADLLTLIDDLKAAVSAAEPSSPPTPPTPPTPPIPGTKVSSISRFGITWTFDKAYEVGTYINGDPWVIGPVIITNITPGATKVNGLDGNGSMIDPWIGRKGGQFPGMQNGYDANMFGQYHLKGDYNTQLNIALQLPKMLQSNQSLVSTETNPQKGARPKVINAAILTIVSKAPSATAFRPSYGRDKGQEFTLNDIDRSKLRKLAPVAGTPNHGEFAKLIDGPWLEHCTWWPQRYMHPKNHMPDYGREIASRIGDAALLLHVDPKNDIQGHETLLINFLQLGLDLYHVARDARAANVLDIWQHAAAGHHSGRKWPILFAGLMFGQQDMIDITQLNHTAGSNFGEDGQTFTVKETSPGIYNFGFGGYTSKDVGLYDWGTAHIYSPKLDDKNWFGDPYRVCCSANAWWGHALSALIMGAKNDWNHDPFFGYLDRYHNTQNSHVKAGTYQSWTLRWSAFALNMWNTYRNQY